MEAKHLDHRYVEVKTTFSPFFYDIGGKREQAISLQHPGYSPRTFITATKYDETIAAFRKLAPNHQKRLGSGIKNGFDQLPPLDGQQALAYQADLKANGLSETGSDAVILGDHILNGGAQRAKPVYDVGGHPVDSNNMNSMIISICMGRMDSVARRFYQEIKAGYSYTGAQERLGREATVREARSSPEPSPAHPQAKVGLRKPS
jgi:hypothetical protein